VTPKLFLPERYAQFAAPILAILLVATGFGRASELGVEAANKPTDTSKHWGISTIRRQAVGAWIAVALVLAVLGGRGTAWVGIEVWIPREERPLYRALSALPQDSIIAGWPLGPLENIPYLSRRRVLTNYQLEIPFHVGFTDMLRKRLNALFLAYFDGDLRHILALHTDYQVTHLLVDEDLCASAALQYYRPYDVVLHEASQSAHKCEKLLAVARDPTWGRKLGHFLLVDLAKIYSSTKDSKPIVR
jgi:hypothetical protein